MLDFWPVVFLFCLFVCTANRTILWWFVFSLDLFVSVLLLFVVCWSSSVVRSGCVVSCVFPWCRSLRCFLVCFVSLSCCACGFCSLCVRGSLTSVHACVISDGQHDLDVWCHTCFIVFLSYSRTRLCLEGFLLDYFNAAVWCIPAGYPSRFLGVLWLPLQMRASSPWFPQLQFWGSPSSGSETKSPVISSEQQVMKRKFWM